MADIHRTLYEAFQGLGQRTDALAAALRWLELSPPLPTLIGRQLYAEQRSAMEELRRYVTGLVQAQPDEADIWSVLALTQAALGNDVAALQAAERVLGSSALSSRAGRLAAHAARGNVYLSRKEARNALAEFQEILTEMPQSYQAAFGRADALAALGEREKALAALDQALAIAVTDWQRVEAQLSRARILARLERPTEAQQALDEARKLDPRSADQGTRTNAD
jgi:tetratricopeptide (TPR) repeat protein